MRIAVTIMLLSAAANVAPAQYYSGDYARPYGAGVFNRPQSATATSPSGRYDFRGAWQGRRYDRLVLRGRIGGIPTVRPHGVPSRRQAGYDYLPQYPQRSNPEANIIPRRTLAPLPVYRHPLADPFYEERVLGEMLGDSSGYYPPW